MKRIAVFLFAALMGVTTVMGDDVTEFMTRYEQVILDIEDFDSSDFDPVELDSVKARYGRLTRQVDRVKPHMKDKDMEQYYKLKARYQKKLTTLKAKRGAKKVIGWVKGLFE